LDEFEAFNPVKPELKLLVAIFSETELKHSAINEQQIEANVDKFTEESVTSEDERIAEMKSKHDI